MVLLCLNLKDNLLQVLYRAFRNQGSISGKGGITNSFRHLPAPRYNPVPMECLFMHMISTRKKLLFFFSPLQMFSFFTFLFQHQYHLPRASNRSLAIQSQAGSSALLVSFTVLGKLVILFHTFPWS